MRFLNTQTLVKQRPYELVYSGELIEPPAPSEDTWKIIEYGTAKEIFDITNVLRMRHNLKPLIWDEITAEVAFGHSKDMYENNDFSHTSKKFGDLATRLKTAQVDFVAAGENIAANYTDGVEAVVEGWLNSTSHRESLFNKDYSHLGVGVYQSTTHKTLFKKWSNKKVTILSPFSISK